MVPGIDPKVDLAFKKVFGTPESRDLTISLIDSILQPDHEHRIAKLDLLNPYSELDAVDDKLTILDVKARDQRGRLFNVEMQMNLLPSLPQRLLFYWAQLYSQQLARGEDFAKLRPTTSICFLNQIMFRDQTDFHTVFRLRERNDGPCLSEDLELHLVEMPKFCRQLDMLKDPLDLWLYFFNNGKELDVDALPTALATSDISKAMEVLRVFSQSELERDRYENRLKGLRDHRGFVRERDEAVRERDEAVRKRDEAVRKQDEAEQKRDEAEQRRDEAEQRQKEAERRLVESKDERRQVVQRSAKAEWEIKQSLLRQIQLSQRLLGLDLMDTGKAADQSIDDLRTLVNHLERQLPQA